MLVWLKHHHRVLVTLPRDKDLYNKRHPVSDAHRQARLCDGYRNCTLKPGTATFAIKGAPTDPNLTPPSAGVAFGFPMRKTASRVEVTRREPNPIPSVLVSGGTTNSMFRWRTAAVDVITGSAVTAVTSTLTARKGASVGSAGILPASRRAARMAALLAGPGKEEIKRSKP